MKDCGADVKCLFEPKSVAVIGASHDESKIGYKVLQNIIGRGYKGKIYGTNPRGGDVLGIKLNKSMAEISEPVDLACICVPAKFVFAAVEDCARNGAKYLSVITSGFSEVGNSEEENKIVDFARRKGMRVLGPNIFGVYSAACSLNATFGPTDIMDGNVAIITQSGALGLAMIGKTAVENIGLSAIVSVGNKADVDEADLLDYLVGQEQTRVILLYVEGVHHGERLVSALKRATKVKPVVVIKSGRSKRGAMAAASHTGSLAGSDEVFDAVMKQCGALRADTVKEAFNWCKIFYSAPLPSGENAVIITNGGGIGVLATDASEKYGVDLYDNPEELRDIFKDVTPDFGSTKNPIDLTGQATPDDYNASLATGLKNPHIHAVMALYCETAVFDAPSLIKVVEEATANYKAGDKPLVFCLFGGEETERAITSLKSKGAPVFDDVNEAVSCLGSLYGQYRRSKKTIPAPEKVAIDKAAIDCIVSRALDDGRSFLLAHEGQEVMAAAGLRVPQSFVVCSADEAVSKAEAISGPVVMKVVSRDILHKSDAGGVALNIQSADGVRKAYDSILANCKKYKADAVIEGIEVVEMVKPGKELIIGARQDSSFGPTVMVGMGGIYVEVMKDVTFRAAPIAREEANDMVKSIHCWPLLAGVRGESPSDVDAVADAIMKLGAIISSCPAITDIEINPLMVYAAGSGGMAVDVRVLVRK